MSHSLTVPPTTMHHFAQAAMPGQRHEQIVKIAVSLISQGFNGEAVFWQIRPNYPADVSDSEIRSIIKWALSRNGDYRFNDRFQSDKKRQSSPIQKTETPNSETAIRRYLGAFFCEEADLWERSPIRLSDNWRDDAITLIDALFKNGETVNIVSEFTERNGKAQPHGCGINRRKAQWIAVFQRNGTPQSDSGVWIRPNPTDGRGVCDANITAHRFLLVEFDAVSIALQTAFIARLTLPIAAIITSGGKSIHAWIRINADNEHEYRAIANRILTALAPFGVDTANKNPSRLSRLPGVYRQIGGGSDKRQRLLYLNPAPKTERIVQ